MKSILLNVVKLIIVSSLAYVTYGIGKDVGYNNARTMKAGDILELVDHPHPDVYFDCKITYIAKSVTQNDTIIFVRLSGCTHKVFNGSNTEVEIFSSRYLRKVL